MCNGLELAEYVLTELFHLVTADSMDSSACSVHNCNRNRAGWPTSPVQILKNKTFHSLVGFFYDWHQDQHFQKWPSDIVAVVYYSFCTFVLFFEGFFHAKFWAFVHLIFWDVKQLKISLAATAVDTQQLWNSGPDRALRFVIQDASHLMFPVNIFHV